MGVRRALAISLGEKYASIFIQLAGSMFVARILSPAEFGIFSLAMSVSILAQVFRDLGVGQYLVQEKDLTPEKIRAAQTILIAASSVLGGLLILGANPAARFYQEPRVIPLLWMLGANFFLLPVGAVTFALWRRNLEFGRLSIITILATFANTITTIALAYTGYSYLSLGWGVLAGSGLTVLLCFAMRPNGVSYLPGTHGVKEVLHYSSLATFNSLMQSLTERAPTLFLGKSSGMTEVGLYERALGVGEIFNRMVMQAVWSIAMPVISDAVRRKQDIVTPYLRATGLIFSVGSTFYVFLAFNAELIITTLFGSQWTASASLLALICISNSLNLVNALASALLVGHGAIRDQTKLTVLLHGCFFIGVVSGFKYGSETMLVGIIFTSIFSNLYVLRILNPFISAKLIIIELSKSVVPAVLIIITLVMLRSFAMPVNLFFPISCVTVCVIFVVYATLTKSPAYEEALHFWAKLRRVA